jgi:NTP pyrophosphatase (non-canonical NTP hydrolase)
MMERDARQEQVHDWCAAAFGADHASSIPQRGLRLLEEAIELAQAAGCDRAMCHKLIDHIFDKPAGTIAQELGGVGVTVLAFAAAANLSADGCERVEVTRVLSKPLEYFAARNKVKNDAGFNVTGAYVAPLSQGRRS